jgi:chemotaxis response regulator CheB
MSDEYPNLLAGIGASAGGLAPLLEIIEHLSFGYQGAILIAMHRSLNAPNTLPELLRSHTRLRVHDAHENEALACTHLYVADADEVMTVEGRRIDIRLDPGRLRRLKRIDDLFASIAETTGSNSAGVILFGRAGGWNQGAEGDQASRRRLPGTECRGCFLSKHASERA